METVKLLLARNIEKKMSICLAKKSPKPLPKIYVIKIIATQCIVAGFEFNRLPVFITN